ncbi:RluA family pseudouridine synthase [Anaeromyxobacter sp. Fw109-5]|uniref:RluA family pseudouridine synthase n=1 Tax=Anaeromyxobacter sp. (strain Fw109-5) TaxID=404589 RepID=UPI0006741390|nr:RluA family pseudouridine synthase [Anaeromyxobacter sp. Fw109-5]
MVAGDARIDRRTFVAPPEVAGARLDVALARLAPELSRARVQRLVEEGRVRVDGRAAKASARLRGGETVDVEIPPPEPSGLVAQELPLAVLYEDADLLVLDKAAGMVVHPARGAPHSTVVNALLHRLGVGAAAPAEGLRLGLVHRLDKDTSGCLVVAKTEPALAALQAQFKGRTVEKRYLALCHGLLAPEGRLDTPYGRHPRDRIRFTTRVKSARRAVTEWRALESFPAGATLAEVTLLTGRTHQIRVHLAEAGHPLLADAVYGGTRREARLPPEHPVRLAAGAIGRQALHAARLAFDHPRTGRRLALEAPLPDDLRRGLQVLRGAAATARPR